MNKKWILSIAAGACALALGACHSAATRIYTLDAAPPTARLDSYKAPALRVDGLSVPAGWDRVEILRPTASGTLEISDFDHWSAQLGQAARQALSADLSERLPSGSLVYPRLPKPNGALGVSVDILEFGVSGSRASMQVSWVITMAGAPQNSGAQGAKRNEALLQSSMSSSEPAGIARAWSQLIGQLADHIAADAAGFQDAN